MKTFMVLKLFILFCITLLPSFVSAQDYLDLESSEQNINHKIKIIAGLAQPVSSFGDNDIYSSNSGFAQTGAAFGIEYNHEFIEHLGIAFTLMGNLHGYDEKMWRKDLWWWSFHSEARQVFSAMIGPLLDVKASSKLILFCYPQVGMVHSNYPNITIRDYTSQEFEYKADAKSTVGYKLSIGAMTGMYDLGIHFLYSNPEFTPQYRYGRQTGDFLPEKKPVKVVLFTAGIIVN